MNGVMQLVRRQLDAVPVSETAPDKLLESVAVVEETVALLLHVWERTSHFDLQQHARWLEDTTNYDAEYAELRSLYRDWAAQATPWCARVERLTQQGVAVIGGATLRDACREVGRILAEGAVYFAGSELDRLA